jgi:MscS family membrane protein
MKSLPTRRGGPRRLAALTLVAWLLPIHVLVAQKEPPPAPAPAKSEAPADSLGRQSPRGTLLGFMRESRAGNHEAAILYLNTNLKGASAVDLARQLFVVLDSRLPARLTNLSDNPEGSRTNPLKPDEDVVGSISTADGSLPVVVERVSRGTPVPVWLFSSQTLNAIPAVYDEIHLISLDGYLPDSVRPRIFGIRLFQWFTLLVVLPLCFRLLGLTGLPGPLRLLVLAIVIRWLVRSIDQPLLERQLWTVVVVLLTIVAGTWLLLRLNAYGERYVREHYQDARWVEVSSLVRLGRRLADVLVVVAGGLVGLAYFGVDPTAALAGLGIGGIAVALAAQKTLENVIGGLSIIFDRAVRVGDFLKLGESFGTVDSIGLRSTRIRTLDRTILSVPNGQIANASIETFSARDKCWFHHFIGLRYETTSSQIRAVMNGIQERLAAEPGIDRQSVRVRLIRFASSSLDIEIFAYALTNDWSRFLEIQERVLLMVMEIIEEAGAAIALPTQTLHISERRTAARALAATVPLPLEVDPAVSTVRQRPRPAAGA